MFKGNNGALVDVGYNGHETIVKYLVEHGAVVQGNGNALE